MMNKTLDGGRRLSRRQFLGAVWGVSIAALVGQFSAAFYNFVKPRPIVGGFGGKVDAGKAKEFKAGSVSYVQSGRFYVSRLDDGSVIALWQRCTHLGCTVPYVKDKKQFQCPCHSSVYNTKGEVISGPAPRPLDLFPIEVVNGDLVVDTGHPITRDKFDPAQATRV
jgi:cytochrome b6-f complex iron-sulfur subunit